MWKFSHTPGVAGAINFDETGPAGNSAVIAADRSWLWSPMEGQQLRLHDSVVTYAQKRLPED